MRYALILIFCFHASFVLWFIDFHAGYSENHISAVIVHSGSTLNRGHYICFVKGSNGRWWKCDDSMVTLADERTVLMSNAYMLVYSKSEAIISIEPRINRSHHVISRFVSKHSELRNFQTPTSRRSACTNEIAMEFVVPWCEVQRISAGRARVGSVEVEKFDGSATAAVNHSKFTNRHRGVERSWMRQNNHLNLVSCDVERLFTKNLVVDQNRVPWT
jgi:hypothetical protein